MLDEERTKPTIFVKHMLLELFPNVTQRFQTLAYCLNVSTYVEIKLYDLINGYEGEFPNSVTLAMKIYSPA